MLLCAGIVAISGSLLLDTGWSHGREGVLRDVLGLLNGLTVLTLAALFLARRTRP